MPAPPPPRQCSRERVARRSVSLRSRQHSHPFPGLRLKHRSRREPREGTGKARAWAKTRGAAPPRGPSDPGARGSTRFGGGPPLPFSTARQQQGRGRARAEAVAAAVAGARAARGRGSPGCGRGRGLRRGRHWPRLRSATCRGWASVPAKHHRLSFSLEEGGEFQRRV